MHNNLNSLCCKVRVNWQNRPRGTSRPGDEGLPVLHPIELAASSFYHIPTELREAPSLVEENRLLDV